MAGGRSPRLRRHRGARAASLLLALCRVMSTPVHLLPAHLGGLHRGRCVPRHDWATIPCWEEWLSSLLCNPLVRQTLCPPAPPQTPPSSPPRRCWLGCQGSCWRGGKSPSVLHTMVTVGCPIRAPQSMFAVHFLQGHSAPYSSPSSFIAASLHSIGPPKQSADCQAPFTSLPPRRHFLVLSLRHTGPCSCG